MDSTSQLYLSNRRPSFHWRSIHFCRRRHLIGTRREFSSNLLSFEGDIGLPGTIDQYRLRRVVAVPELPHEMRELIEKRDLTAYDATIHSPASFSHDPMTADQTPCKIGDRTTTNEQCAKNLSSHSCSDQDYAGTRCSLPFRTSPSLPSSCSWNGVSATTRKRRKGI